MCFVVAVNSLNSILRIFWTQAFTCTPPYFRICLVLALCTPHEFCVVFPRWLILCRRTVGIRRGHGKRIIIWKRSWFIITHWLRLLVDVYGIHIVHINLFALQFHDFIIWEHSYLRSWNLLCTKSFSFCCVGVGLMYWDTLTFSSYSFAYITHIVIATVLVVKLRIAKSSGTITSRSIKFII